ncbi:MAG: trypsin-like peptidase domain-containing protein [Enterocloster asparagiformis]|nr:trypsin-like peptidase domain-containing protein [Enterocloster asparagiformis]
MKRITRGALCLFLIVALMAGGFTAYGKEGEESAAAAAREGVVRIMVFWPDGYSFGTGFGIGEQGKDADTFLTNWHVVTNSGQHDYRDGRIFILLDDETWLKYQWFPLEPGDQVVDGGDYIQDSRGTVYQRFVVDVNLGAAVECEVLYAENQYPDVAVLRTAEPVRNVKTLPLRRVSQEFVGEDVRAIGYPGSADSGSVTHSEDGTELERIKASVEAVSLSGGVISRCLPLEFFGNTDCIDHGAHINHGNSGGPLVLKKDGSVIGINTYGYGENYSEYNASIYIDYAIDVLDQLGLTYTMAEDGSRKQSKGPAAVLIGVGILAALAVAAAVLRKKRRRTAAALQPGAESRSGAESQQGAQFRQAAASQPAAVFLPEQQVLPPGLSGGGIAGGAQSELRLQGLSGVFAGRRFRLKPETRIGRDPQRCDFVYPAGTKGISGLHCVITQGQNGFTITDVGSTCGTTVNGRKLAPNQACALNIGDKICLGSVNEEFQITGKGGAV